MKKVLIALLIACSSLAAQQSPHGSISIPCDGCHSTDSWSMRTDAQFDHAKTGFPLAGRHKIAACKSCHEKLVFTGASTACASCHSDVHGSELGTSCLRCHSNDSWIITNIRQLHQQTRFPLVGQHLLADCDQCHLNTAIHRYAGTPLNCIGCHRDVYLATQNPNHARAGFSLECGQCHSVTAASWPGAFDHSRTIFPLTGAHQALACIRCHPDSRFAGLPIDCYGCHAADFSATLSPNHQTDGFSHSCLACHNTAAWSPSTFDHSTTHFPLAGAHRTLDCAQCHGSGNYNLVYTACYQCHQSDFQGTSNPSHTGFSHDCLACHAQNAWNPAVFDHSTTHFPLTGAHISVACLSCHTGGNFQLVYTDCYQCHASAYNGATDPGHAAGLFSHDCSSCHSTIDWSNSTFNHSATHFPLTGAHTTLNCQSCHTNGNYQLVYADCYQCHQSNFQGATNPPHAGFSHDCTACHSTTAWSPATFDHSTTHFPLTGRHLSVSCQNCHTGGNYQLVYTDCYQCHAAQYNQTTDPNHAANNFSHDCSQCHNTNSWGDLILNHSTTGFALTGAHAAVNCQSCHVNGNYTLMSGDCFQCHQSNFQNVTNPSHAGFSHLCVTCHTTTAWSPATFDHAATHFPLTGSHVAVSCITCHAGGNYQLVYTDCYPCHSANYSTPTNPDHVAAQLSHDCSTCHTTLAWTPSTFNHASTGFTLTGGHTTITCQSCHTGGNYHLAFSDCYQCHSANYSTPVDPDHVAANFAHDCTSCHTTANWTSTTFQHDALYFRIYSGRHGGRWTSCYTCHQNKTDLSQFTCLSCHEHSQAETDSNHSEVSGYTYASPACYSCHRNA